MENQVTVTDKKEIAVQQWSEDDLGMDNLISQDVTPPRIMLMQPMSNMLLDEKLGAKAGQIRESVEGRHLGGNGKALRVVPFFMTNTWVIRKKISDTEFEFVRAEERTAQNANLEFEFVEDGVTHKREKTMNLFCFLHEDVLAGNYVPYMISFQRTSFTTAAKKMSTLMTMLKGSKKPLWSCVLEVDSEKRTNENDKPYYVYKLSLAKNEGKEITLSVDQQNEAYTNYLAVRSAYNQGRIQKHVEERAAKESSENTEDIPF